LLNEKEPFPRAVIESEVKYRMLVENSLQGLAIIQDQRIVFCNKKFSEMSGYSIQELLAFSPDQNAAVVHPKDRVILDDHVRSCQEGRLVSSSLEYRVIKKDGSETWLEIYSSPIEYQGKPALQSAFMDITERKHAEEALRKSEERFNLIAESIDEIFWMLDCDKEVITYISPAYERIYGRPKEGFLGDLKSFLDPIHLDDLPRIKATFELLQNGLPFDFEHRMVRPDGSLRRLWTRCFPVADESGAVKNYVGVAQDVTEWRRAEKDLRDSKEYLDRIINCLGDPVFVKDEKNRMVLVNKAFCAFTGTRPDEVIGKSADQFLPDERMDSGRDEEQIALETGKEFVSQEEISDKDGNIRTVLTKRTLLQDKSGKKQIVGVLRDITEYKRLEAQFFQAQKMEAIRVLTGGVAHDFNNLLSVIRGYTELLMEEFKPGDQRLEDLDQIDKAGQRATSLISQLLAFSRKQILQPEVLNLNAIVSDMSKMLRRLIGEDIDLSTVVQPDLASVNADPGQIQQIIMNLALNAREAMPKGGRLTIETANAFLDDVYIHQHPIMNKGRYVMLAISDNGIGMDEATRARIFEPFFSTKEKNKGAGLGLSTIYGIVKQSNGFIWVYSEPGKGSTFKIYFPRVEDEFAQSLKDDLPEGECKDMETVLIAEDEESVRALACRILRARGYAVLEASNGRQALDVAQQYPGAIDIVLTDVIMPEMDGSTLVSHLKATRPGIKALFFSGYTNEAIVQHGVLDSNVDFLQKPFSASGLVRKLREVIDAPIQ
jgi:two-component system, cell cycle sensor histidine kinase and response regulator CckA